jgi:hypothetical protein
MPDLDQLLSLNGVLQTNMDVSHDIVSSYTLFYTCSLEISIADFEVTLHLLQSLRGDGFDAELGLGLCQVKPQLSPCRMARALAEKTRHLRTAVPARQGRLILVESQCHVESTSDARTVNGTWQACCVYGFSELDGQNS